MNKTLTINYENTPAYDIMFEHNFEQLPVKIKEIGMANRRFMIISDSTVSTFYLEELITLIRSEAKIVESYIFPAGEGSKNLDTVSQCYEQLINSCFDRNDVLIALGGGVVGDLTGFVAATYLRGIRFIQLPTSLLAMVDSSIGGKTGVDYRAYKNMVGAFHQPQLVYMNLSTLLSLNDSQFHSGMGEIIKHGLIKETAYYNWLKDNQEGILSKNYDTLQEMIYRSCLIKKAVVEQDPKELGERALLNFGHTIGHSVEKLKELTLLHGECVSIGMAAAAYISLKRGNLSDVEYHDIIATIELFHEPVNVTGLDPQEVYEVTKLDKKMDSDKIRFILLKGIGNSVIDPTVTKDEILEAIRSVID
jgi:3-dehydroquinate synthase